MYTSWMPSGKITRNNRRMVVALYRVEHICYHIFDCR
jgi:hypothetical protein